MQNWEFGDADRALFEEELDSFVPDRVFDAHAHWYRLDHFPDTTVHPLVMSGPKIAGVDAYLEAMEQLTPGRKTEGLIFPFPFVGMKIDAANQFLYEELQKSPGSRGQMLIVPEHDPEFIRETVTKYNFVGLKCYHVYSSHKPTFDSSIEAFLPERQIAIAHELGLSITLHMVRQRALADKGNQETIRRYCLKYPNMKLILAHAARGFNPHHTILGIDSLRGLDNVYCDTSAITDAGAFEAIIRTIGHERLLYGTDYPVSQLRGRCVGLGDSFFWIDATNTQLQVPYADLQLSLIGLESLRTLKIAAMSTGLTDSQVEDIFCNNTRRLFNLTD